VGARSSGATRPLVEFCDYKAETGRPTVAGGEIRFNRRPGVTFRFGGDLAGGAAAQAVGRSLLALAAKHRRRAQCPGSCRLSS